MYPVIDAASERTNSKSSVTKLRTITGAKPPFDDAVLRPTVAIRTVWRVPCAFIDINGLQIFRCKDS